MELQRYTIDYNSFTTDNPDGEWVKAEDVTELEEKNRTQKTRLIVLETELAHYNAGESKLNFRQDASGTN